MGCGSSKQKGIVLADKNKEVARPISVTAEIAREPEPPTLQGTVMLNNQTICDEKWLWSKEAFLAKINEKSDGQPIRELYLQDVVLEPPGLYPEFIGTINDLID